MSRELDILNLEKLPVAPGVEQFGQLGPLDELRWSPPTQAGFTPSKLA